MPMNDPTVENLTLGLILYLLLPLWVIVGSLDYLCHRASHIERNDGLRESLMHMGMGVLVGIPIWLGIFCKINVLVMLVCFICFILHEIVAHNDVVWAASRRRNFHLGNAPAQLFGNHPVLCARAGHLPKLGRLHQHHHT